MITVCIQDNGDVEKARQGQTHLGAYFPTQSQAFQATFSIFFQ